MTSTIFITTKMDLTCCRTRRRSRFIWGDFVLIKDKDAPVDASTGMTAYCGGDVTSELPVGELQRLGVTSRVIGPLSNVSFALLCRFGEELSIRRRLNCGDQLRLGTSYPRSSKRLLGECASIDVVRLGSTESLPGRYPELDGVVDIVRSGRTATQNNLVVVDVLEDIDLIKLDGKRS